MPFSGEAGRGGGGGGGGVSSLRKMFLFDSLLPFKSYESLRYENRLGQKVGYSGNRRIDGIGSNNNGERIIESNCDCDYVYRKGRNETFGGGGGAAAGSSVLNEWFKDSNGKRTDFLSVLFIYPLCCMILAGKRKNKVRNKR